MGVSPSCLHFSSVMMSAAEAPSVRKEELAAVTVPCGLMNAGFSLAIFSAGVMRIPLSTVMKSLPLGVFTGMTSERLPASAAALARVWLLLAKSSCSCLVTPKVAARRSALWPIVSPVENSAIAGSSGFRWSILILLRRPSILPVDLALFASSMRALIFLDGDWRDRHGLNSITPPLHHGTTQHDTRVEHTTP